MLPPSTTDNEDLHYPSHGFCLLKMVYASEQFIQRISLTLTSAKRSIEFAFSVAVAPCSRSTTVTTRSARPPASRNIVMPYNVDAPDVVTSSTWRLSFPLTSPMIGV